jgi:hypothetical protein
MNRIATFAVAAAGVIHLIVAPQHYAHAPAHGIFFVVVGLAEIAWAIIFLGQPTQRVYYTGLLLTGGLLVLWAVTRIIPAPFHGHAEAVDLGGIVCKISELVGLAALLLVAAQGGIAGLSKQAFVRLAAVAVILSLAAGALSYGIGRAAEPLFPSLFGESAEHHHEDGEDHEHGEEHEHEEEHEHDE